MCREFFFKSERKGYNWVMENKLAWVFSVYTNMMKYKSADVVLEALGS